MRTVIRDTVLGYDHLTVLPTDSSEAEKVFLKLRFFSAAVRFYMTDDLMVADSEVLTNEIRRLDQLGEYKLLSVK